MLEDFDLNKLQDLDQARQCIIRLLNLVEELVAENRALRAENQELRDEINRLKGEQGKPSIQPNRKPESVASGDHSSESERHKPKSWKKGSKVDQIRIDREEVLQVEPGILPADAEFKGYEAVVVQDVRIQTDNVRFLKEKFYSAREHRTYLAQMPGGYSGEFGPGIRCLVLVWYFACQMTEPKIVELLDNVGVKISEGEISNLLIKDQEAFHTEAEAVYAAGLRSSPWQHLDDTGTRVNGENYHCPIVDNPLHTTFVTTKSKDRLSILEVLRHGQPRVFRLNEEALGYLEIAGVSEGTRKKVADLVEDRDLDEAAMEQLLDIELPGLGAQTRKWILDACAVSAYHAQTEWPVVRLLNCDGAPQFTWVTEELARCWVQEGRHYKKLVPYVPRHRQKLTEFLEKFWGFYDELLAYREQSTLEERTRLEAEFDTLFSTVIGYQALDERIKRTLGKKTSLLMVLKHPEIPLHNNPAELAARKRVRKRDISFGPRTSEGVKAWDTFQSLASTAKKLGVSFYQYIRDRITGANQIPNLAELVDERAKVLNLGASWDTS
ncbi:MAG: transposase [Nitrospira sp.]|nr:transposase [Nitrospira sp.]